MRVLREEAFRRGTQIGEVAAPAAGDQDLPARPVGMVEHQHAGAGLPRRRRRKEPGAARPENDRIVVHRAPSKPAAAAPKARIAAPLVAAERRVYPGDKGADGLPPRRSETGPAA